VDKTVYAGHDAGGSCAGGESVVGENGQPVTYCFTVTNTGDTTLAPVTVSDGDLGITDGDMTVLSGSLAGVPAAGTVTLYYETTIDRDLLNTATAVGVPIGRDDGPVVGFPEGVSDDDTAEVDELAPELGVAKTVTAQPVGNGDGSYTLTYGVEVQNTGDFDLSGLQLTDDLQATFAGALSFSVNEVRSDDLTANWPGFDGIATGDPGLLAGTDTLPVGGTGTVFVTVTVVPGAKLGPYDNTAIGKGESPADETVTDISDSGTDSNPNRSNPDEPGDTGGTDDPVPTEFPPIDLTVAKVSGVTAVPASGGPVDWDVVVTNNGPGDDTGPITVVDELEAPLSYVAAAGDGWGCSYQAPKVTCVWSAPLAAGSSTTPVTISTEATDPQQGTITNAVVVTTTGTETDTTNNDGTDVIEVDSAPEADQSGVLPRTGATIAGLVLLGLGLVVGGRVLLGGRRRRNAT
jgi:uncharacterized repeat protein (TIGR01451 family)/LPXTG-motif cell wall-anchored protein